MKFSQKEIETINKVNSIIETETETETIKKEKKEMKFNLPGKETEKETEKAFNLELKKGENKKTFTELKKENLNGINQENLNLSIEKFNAIETMIKSNNAINETIQEMKKTFNDMVSEYSELKKVLIANIKQLNTIETIETNLLKNQVSTLNGINSLNANFKKSISFNGIETETEKEIETETEKEIETKLKKNTENIDCYQTLFDLFIKAFKGNFLGSDKLNNENSAIWKSLIDFIDDTSADTITETIKKYRSIFTKNNKGSLLNAKRSNKKFIEAMINAIEIFNNKTVKREKAPGKAINKAYFTSAFNMKLKDLDTIIKKVSEYGQIDNQVKETIEKYCFQFNSDITEKDFETFYTYLENFISE